MGLEEDNSSIDAANEDDSYSNSSSLIDEQNVGEAVQGLLEEIPIRFWVLKWVDQSDMYAWEIVAGNKANANMTDNQEFIGKRLADAFPDLNEPPVFERLVNVSKTGNPLTFLDEKFGSLYKVTETALPGNCVFLTYEDLNMYTDLEAKRKQNFEQMEALMDKAIDFMIRTKHGEDIEGDDVNIMALKTVFNFSEGGAHSGLLVEEFEKKQKVISMADVNTLVTNLSTGAQDNKYMRQFLTTYRYFMSPSVLLKKMMVKYMTGSGADADNVVECFKIWIKEHFYDYESDPELLKTLQEFINNAMLNSNQGLTAGESLNRLIKKQVANEQLIAGTNSPESPLGSRKFKFKMLEESPTEVAHQMTLICFDRFKAIKPMEFYDLAWTKPNGHLSSPNIVQMIKTFNNVTSWVSNEVLSQKVLKNRVNAVRYFIEIAWATYGYRDFEATFAVMMGLRQQTVSRLSETWRNLDQSTKQRYLKLHEFTDYKKNYRNYRKTLNYILSSELGSNVIPYFSLYLKDLTILEENTSFSQAGAVNFHKMRKMANTINEIKKAQCSIFAFQKNVQIVGFLTTELRPMDEDAQWVHSKKCEAESTGEDPAEICAQAGPITASTLLRIQSRSSASAAETLVHSNPIFGLNIKKGSIKLPARSSK